uniref:Uncharacterized protein n=1 Tax=Oryza rufipogon TaxID=4529 RepID=A0A0E0QXH7_ORYRU
MHANVAKGSAHVQEQEAVERCMHAMNSNEQPPASCCSRSLPPFTATAGGRELQCLPLPPSRSTSFRSVLKTAWPSATLNVVSSEHGGRCPACSNRAGPSPSSSSGTGGSTSEFVGRKRGERRKKG